MYFKKPEDTMSRKERHMINLKKGYMGKGKRKRKRKMKRKRRKGKRTGSWRRGVE